MFSGIVEATAKIQSVRKDKTGRMLEISMPPKWRFKKGQSVAIDGVCSTVVRIGQGAFVVEYMPETLRCTTAGDFKKDDRVNLERSLRYGASVDGHFVQGHVGGVGEVIHIEGKSSREVTIRIPAPLRKYVAHKGSIAINGVSLTVARMQGTLCTVALIPHTLAHTNLGVVGKGALVNIETDLIARQLAQLMKK